MKQSSRGKTAFDNHNYSGKNFSDDVDDDDDDDEEMTMINMASILLQLKNQDLEYGLPYSWGHKRRRSAIDLTPPSSPLALPPEEPPRGAAQDGGGGLEVKEAKEIKKATSPSTPLSFSPSESDEKSTPTLKRTTTSCSKIFTKKKKEELSHEVLKLTETRDTLKREVENVRQYYEEQRAINLKLKAKKIKLSSYDDDKERASSEGMENNNLNPGMQIAQPQQVKLPFSATSFQDQFQPSIIADMRLHPTAVRVAETPCDELQTHIFIGAGLGVNRNQRVVGPRDRLPDLNLTSDESRDVDHCPPSDGVPRGSFFLTTDWRRAFSAGAVAKAQAAEARKNRMQICKVKIKNSAKSRPGHR